MPRYIYQVDDELRVTQEPAGYRQVGLRKSVSAPSEALEGHIEAVKDFRDDIEELRKEFVKEAVTQEADIEEQIKHIEFFLKDSRQFHWDDNQMYEAEIP